MATFGTVDVRLTSVGPLGTMGLGVGIGSWDGTTCTTTTTSNPDARSGAIALSGSIVAGQYCARVFDSGNVPVDWTVTYTVQVAHP
ncbi:MAG: hypothetical protein IT459_10150 [Planctomycetes bacterium]|nr:hypothetical protein [Planctomycetota bacterium]